MYIGRLLSIGAIIVYWCYYCLLSLSLSIDVFISLVRILPTAMVDEVYNALMMDAAHIDVCSF